MSNPWMKFYPSDWRADPALRMCSLGARGLWMEMLCLMHEAGGFLTVNGKELLPRQLAALSGASVDDVTAWMVELSDAGVFSRDERGFIYSRRMLKDLAKAAADKANGRKGGNPVLKGGVNPPVGGGDKAQKPEARSQKLEPEKKEGESAPDGAPPSETSGEVVPFKPNAKGSRLPADWSPNSELIEFARNEGLTDDQIRRELASFRDYFLAASGPNAVKRDWNAAGRIWLRKAASGFGGSRRPSPSGHGSPSGGRFGAMQRALARVSNPDDVPE